MKHYVRFEQCRPDELAALVELHPVAYWPLGLIEHHGWHLPVGFDGIKAERICVRLATETGGAILPVMWWGAGGGHGEFNWTLYQNEHSAGEIVATTVRKLIHFGFKVIVLLAGHYPWRSTLSTVLPDIQNTFSETLIIAGTEMEISGEERLPGDHAALEETSYGLALLPELIDMAAMRPGRTDRVWPDSGPPPIEDRIEALDYEPGSPLFAQAGRDAREASNERGSQSIDVLVKSLSGRICSFLEGDL